MIGGEKLGRESQSKRRQTVLELLDALHELQDDYPHVSHLNGTAVLDRPNEDPDSDEQLQKEGALAFATFQGRVQDLDSVLQNFSNSITTIGSSAGLLSSSFRLRQRLTRILFLMRGNAADLYPRRIRRENNTTGGMLRQNFRVRAKIRSKAPLNVARPHLDDEELDAESFPAEIEGLAQDTIQFASLLNEFPEFCDEALNAAIMAFQHDLKYWASSLGEFKGQYRVPGFGLYVHNLSTEIGEHFESITSALVHFVAVVVPTIQYNQTHSSDNLMNLTTVATFFSGITATIMGSAVDRTAGVLENFVNCLWFCSLVFSIASALSSLVGMTWRQTIYRSPRHRVPWIVTIWIKQCPLVFLVISVIAFSVGLCLFTWATFQPRWICLLVTVFTCCSFLGLLAFSIWFVFERFVYSRYNGQVWLDDAITDLSTKLRKSTGVEWMKRVPPRHIRAVSITVVKYGAQLFRIATHSLGILPMHARSSRQSPIPADIVAPLPLGSNVSPAQVPDGTPSSVSISAPSSAPARPVTQQTLTLSAAALPFPHTPFSESESGPAEPWSSRPNDRLRNAVRSVILANRSARSFWPSGAAAEQASRRTTIRRHQNPAPLTAGRLTPIERIRGALNQVHVTQIIPVHQALVRSLAFSPNGKQLATCSWDRTSAILNMADLSSHRILDHPNGFVGQIMWSPNGSLLLTKLTSGVTLWTAEGVCKMSIERRTAVHGVAWFQSSEEFISIETNEAVHLDTQGRIIANYHFERLRLHNIAITKDGERLIVVATLEQTRNGYTPVKARPEERIVVYNRLRKTIEHQVPVLHDVRDITLLHNDRFALVSYENKAPPQLWRVDMVKEGARLALARTYMPTRETDFAGPSYFGGKNDQMVLCASKGGDVHVWDRDSGALLHYYPPQMCDEDITCIAWNSAAEGHVFCTGSHDGTVRLWEPGTATPGGGGTGAGSFRAWQSSFAEGGGEGTLMAMKDEPEALQDIHKRRMNAIMTDMGGKDQSYDNGDDACQS